MIKNTTPYKGKIKIRIEKDPYYTGGRSGILNKVHFDLGFTKIVSRMIPERTKSGDYKVDKNRVALIEKFTGGVIDTYRWWEVKGVDGTFTSHKEPANKKDVVFAGELPNSFMTREGDYLGGIVEGWWYYKNSFLVCEEFPKGVAVQVSQDFFKDSNRMNFAEKTAFKGDIEGYYGYSHRGGCLFKIGDRLFESDYIPKKEDYTEIYWDALTEMYRAILHLSKGLGREDLEKDGISSVMSFSMRGSKKIETLEEAKQAAYNLSKYLS
jgi:hypothetical protein